MRIRVGEHVLWILLPNGPAGIGNLLSNGQQTGAVDPAIQRTGSDRCYGSCYLMGWRTCAVDPATQSVGRDKCYVSCHHMGWRTGAVDPATQSVGRDRCYVSCHHMDWRTGAMDPATLWAGEQALRILLPNGPAGISAIDPATLWAGEQVLWILLPNGPEDRCRGSFLYADIHTTKWPAVVVPVNIDVLGLSRKVTCRFVILTFCYTAPVYFICICAIVHPLWIDWATCRI